MILINGKVYTLADALEWLRQWYGTTGPIFSSERA